MQETTADFAILIPHYNQSELLDGAVLSCSKAKHAEKAHLVIVDDGSSSEHDVSDLLERWSQSGPFKKITLVRNIENAGVSTSLNNGLQHIEEPYFFRIDADDRALPDRFERQLRELQSGYDLVFSEAEIVYEGELVARSFSPSLKIIRSAMPFHNLLMHPTLAARTEFFLQCGGYPQNTPTEDWDFWRKNMPNAKVMMVREPLLRLGLSLDSVSNAKFDRAPGFEKTFRLRTALRYNDRQFALRAAKRLGPHYSTAVFVLPNLYRVRLYLRLLKYRLTNLIRAGVN